MKKLLTIVTALLFTSNVYAGFGVGVSGSLFNVEADVTETTSSSDALSGSDTHSTSVDNDVVPVPGIFGEYTFDAYPITLGVEMTLGSADVSDKVKTRTETPASGENSGTATTYKANASIENLTSLYVEIPVYNNFFVKAGALSVDVTTEESGVASYGNVTGENGTMYGFGIKSGNDAGYNYKLAYEVLDFDTISVTSSSGNKVAGDIDTSGLKFSIVYNF